MTAPWDLTEMRARLLIGGTGRSGTTLLHTIISRHPAIYGVPFESKFLSEADGLADLFLTLTERYTMTHAERALYRFDDFMRHGLSGFQPLGIKYWRFDAAIGSGIYYGALNEFIKSIVSYEFDEIIPNDAFSHDYKYNWPSQPKVVRRVLPAMFEDPEELATLCRRLVDRMFGAAAKRAGKAAWCEKTPSNLYQLDFLWRLFPDALVLHIKRDPRGVVHSMMQQPFTPRDPAAACALVRTMFAQWARCRDAALSHGDRYIELKLEDLVSDPQAWLDLIFARAGLPAFTVDPAEFAPGKVDSWRTEMPADVRTLAEQELGEYFPLMGYTC